MDQPKPEEQLKATNVWESDGVRVVLKPIPPDEKRHETVIEEFGRDAMWGPRWVDAIEWDPESANERLLRRVINGMAKLLHANNQLMYAREQGDG